VPWSSPHGFLNQEQSAQTDLVQLGARAYDSTLGRFLSVDSVLAPMNPLQNNGYSYAANGPISGSDASGDCMLSSDGNACVLGAGAGGYAKAFGTSNGSPAAPGKKQSKAGGSSGCAPNFQDYVFGNACQTAANKAATAARDKQAASNAAKEAALEAQVQANAYAQMLPWQRWLYNLWSPYADVYNNIAPGVDAIAAPVAGGALGKGLAGGLDEEAGSAGAAGAAASESGASETAPLISVQKQARHVLGSENYAGGGYFLKTSDAQEVLDAYRSGEASVVETRSNGNVVVKFRGVTGFNNNVGAGYLNQPTNTFIIKGQKSVSVVPTVPGG